jgi:hypothetical protein
MVFTAAQRPHGDMTRLSARDSLEPSREYILVSSREKLGILRERICTSRLLRKKLID